MRTLLLIMAIIGCNAVFLQAQDIKVIVSEDLSSQRWHDELVRLNPEYETPDGPNGVFEDVNEGPYFDNYILKNGDIEVISLPENGMCGDLSTIHKFDDVAVSWKMGPTGDANSYVQMTLPSVGRMTVHFQPDLSKTVKNIGIDTRHIYQDGDSLFPNLTHKKFTVDKKFYLGQDQAPGRQVDEVFENWIGSREPITIRMSVSSQSPADSYVKLLAFSVEEHPTIPLKVLIDSAQVILEDNIGNIGEDSGQYSQDAYSALEEAVDAATEVYEDYGLKRPGYVNGINAIKEAITVFLESKNETGVGFINLKSVFIQQNGRIITTGFTTNIAVYNSIGVLVHERSEVNQIEIPASVARGVYIIKTPDSTHKIILSN